MRKSHRTHLQANLPVGVDHGPQALGGASDPHRCSQTETGGRARLRGACDACVCCVLWHSVRVGKAVHRELFLFFPPVFFFFFFSTCKLQLKKTPVAYLHVRSTRTCSNLDHGLVEYVPSYVQLLWVCTYSSVGVMMMGDNNTGG